MRTQDISYKKQKRKDMLCRGSSKDVWSRKNEMAHYRVGIDNHIQQKLRDVEYQLSISICMMY